MSEVSALQRRKPLPRPVVRRLPRYLTHVELLRGQGVQWVSSIEMAKALGLTSSTVRQDLSHLDLSGVSKRGYDTSRLAYTLERELGTHSVHRLIIVGAGYLGCALALHGDLLANGFEVSGIFDADPELTGSSVGRLRVRPMGALPALVRRKKVELGMIAVPAAAAQSVADVLVRAGLQGILNLTYLPLKVPDHVTVIDARLLGNLQELAYVVRTRDGGGVAPERAIHRGWYEDKTDLGA